MFYGHSKDGIPGLPLSSITEGTMGLEAATTRWSFDQLLEIRTCPFEPCLEQYSRFRVLTDHVCYCCAFFSIVEADSLMELGRNSPANGV